MSGLSFTNTLEAELVVSPQQPATSMPTRTSSPMRDFLIDTALSTLIPLFTYRVSKGYFGASDLTALVDASLYPTLKSIFDLTRKRQLNPVSILVVLGVVTSIGALLLGGGTRILLIRESLLTAAFGLACFVSLLLPRPLMFYFGRYYTAGNDPEKIAEVNLGWNLPEVRQAYRLITLVWGCTLIGEFSLRTWMVLQLPTAVVLSVAPILFNATTFLTFFWSMRHGKRVRARLSR